MDLALSAVMCVWCGLAKATVRVIGTDACGSCAASRHVRVKAALQRWKRGKERR